jgi:hypothetical protein
LAFDKKREETDVERPGVPTTGWQGRPKALRNKAWSL